MATRKTPSKSSKPAVSKAGQARKPAEVIDPEESLVRLCAEGALDKKAENVVILDMRGISTFTDFFLIASGTSEPQLKAIVASIREKVREKTGLKPTAEDGFPSSKWVIVDYGSVIVHVFHSETRPVYGLEDLWNDARRIEITG
jgi:ribosome-associated protein